MAREDIIMLSRKEMSRVKIIHAVLEKQMTQVEAGNTLSISTVEESGSPKLVFSVALSSVSSFIKCPVFSMTFILCL